MSSSLINACCSVVWNDLENSIENESGIAACYESEKTHNVVCNEI